MAHIKVAVMGAGNVGKSCITMQFTQGVFVETYNPTIEDSFRRTVTLDDGRVCSCEITDTAGTEGFVALRNLYMTNCEAFLVVYSITSRETLTEAESIITDILRVAEVNGKTRSIILVGNKTDLESQRDVSTEEGGFVAKGFPGCKFVEITAKNGSQVDRVFKDVTKSALGHLAIAEEKANRKRLCTIL